MLTFKTWVPAINKKIKDSKLTAFILKSEKPTVSNQVSGSVYIAGDPGSGWRLGPSPNLQLACLQSHKFPQKSTIFLKNLTKRNVKEINNS